MSPMRPRHRCAKPGCPTLIHPDQRFCADHQSYAKAVSRRRYKEKQNDPTWQLYQQPSWKRFRTWLRGMNPICQLIVDGRQCTALSEVVHHKKAVRTHPHLMFVASNCVCLCLRHHDNRPGEDENDQRDFVPTREDVWGTDSNVA